MKSSTGFSVGFQNYWQFYSNCKLLPCRSNDRDSFFIIVSGARPYSRGWVRLASSNPSKPPLIDPKYLEDKDQMDLKVLLEAVKKSVSLVENSTALGKQFGAEFTSDKLPGCEHLEMRSDEYWICYIRRYT